uniref:RAB22A, member RAS oncogene family n=2 Tax=Sus scrofa TaxID=9823 RepID=A0A5G2Q7J8_PIG
MVLRRVTGQDLGLPRVSRTTPLTAWRPHTRLRSLGLDFGSWSHFRPQGVLGRRPGTVGGMEVRLMATRSEFRESQKRGEGYPFTGRRPAGFLPSWHSTSSWASFMTKTVQYQNELHKFLIWDTAGQERFRALAPMYYRGSAAAIIVYDITKEETFSTLKNWVKELRQHGPPNIVVAIAGNKCDLIDVREVLERDAKDYADSIHAIFVETSAKNAININELFIEISRRIPSTDASPPSGGKGFKLRRQPSEPKRSCC